jgi:hypothetical protein
MHVSHVTEKLDALYVIPDRTYRGLFSVNLITFALEEFQNRVERIDGVCSCLGCKRTGFFFLCACVP